MEGFRNMVEVFSGEEGAAPALGKVLVSLFWETALNFAVFNYFFFFLNFHVPAVAQRGEEMGLLLSENWEVGCELGSLSSVKIPVKILFV